MAPSYSSDTVEGGLVGPHPSYIQIAKPYIFDHQVQKCMKSAGIPESKDDNIRLQGVAWIDSVRKALHLPVRTYNTAVVYYHKFRLLHPDTNGFIVSTWPLTLNVAEHQQDAAGAALFAACKIEDTLKKSKEILCAACNLKLSPAEHVTPDDPMFESHSKVIIGLERLMLEASGFDFRNRSPQRLVLKLAKYYRVYRETVGKTAYNISLDLYRTFAPLKQTTPAMAIACVELSGRIHEEHIKDLELGRGYKRWSVTRPQVMGETSTAVGPEHAIEQFISIRITLNQEASAQNFPRFTMTPSKKIKANGTKATNGATDHKDKKSIISPRDDPIKNIRSPQEMVPVNSTASNGKPGLRDGTVRFMLDPERVRDEKLAVAEFFKEEEEEYEVEVERERRRV
ncbi:MAG: hypothetical protein Q9195_003631 [Heterodermia aff. obscurata]